MLLEALKQVGDPVLRREIIDALTPKMDKKKAKPMAEPETANAMKKKIEELKRLVKGNVKSEEGTTHKPSTCTLRTYSSNDHKRKKGNCGGYL